MAGTNTDTTVRVVSAHERQIRIGITAPQLTQTAGLR